VRRGTRGFGGDFEQEGGRRLVGGDGRGKDERLEDLKPEG
jgi:hypothetical protein